jgi:hypothetical protein
MLLIAQIMPSVKMIARRNFLDKLLISNNVPGLLTIPICLSLVAGARGKSAKPQQKAIV